MNCIFNKKNCYWCGLNGVSLNALAHDVMGKQQISDHLITNYNSLYTLYKYI